MNGGGTGEQRGTGIDAIPLNSSTPNPSSTHLRQGFGGQAGGGECLLCVVCMQQGNIVLLHS